MGKKRVHYNADVVIKGKRDPVDPSLCYFCGQKWRPPPKPSSLKGKTKLGRCAGCDHAIMPVGPQRKKPDKATRKPRQRKPKPEQHTSTPPWGSEEDLAKARAFMDSLPTPPPRSPPAPYTAAERQRMSEEFREGGNLYWH
jgi:hypothetical protein